MNVDAMDTAILFRNYDFRCLARSFMLIISLRSSYYKAAVPSIGHFEIRIPGWLAAQVEARLTSCDRPVEWS